MNPPPSDNDAEDARNRYELVGCGLSKGFRGDKYYDFQDNPIREVLENFRDFRFPIEIIICV